MNYPAVSLHLKDKSITGALLTQGGVGLALLVLVLLVSLQLAPSVIPQGRDSGIFAYTGQVIREGGLPYRDAWDNKPPGVYYIDALAFVLFGPNRWALWLIETLTVFLTGWLLYWLLSQIFSSRLVVWTGTLSMVLLTRHPILVEDTNFTEVDALLPQMACYLAGYLFLINPRHRWGFLIGASLGIAFLIKQTTVGVAFMFIPALVISRHPVVYSPRRWNWLGGIIMGGLLSLGLVTAYLAWNGVLFEAIEATFISPMEFHSWVSGKPVGIPRRILLALFGSAAPLVVGPLIPFLYMGFQTTFRRVRAARQGALTRPEATAATLSLWAAMTLVIDTFLTNTTNRGYGHYYITLLPALVLMLMPAIERMVEWLHQPNPTPDERRRLRWAWFGLALGIAGPALVGTTYRFWQINWDVAGPARVEPLATYVMQHTQPTDTVLVWGAATAINFQSERLSPTQYHYGYPLILPNEDRTEAEQIQEIISDLETNRPTLIIDRSLVDGLRVPPLDAGRRAAWYALGGRHDTADLRPVYAHVARHCIFVEELNEAAIYRCHY